MVAQCKAQAVSKRYPEGLVIGADTVVIGPRGQVLGKPTCAAEAESFLMELSGREHQVATGLALVWDGGKKRDITRSVSRVWMRHFDVGEAVRYVATGEPFDKAGAYGIQGRGAVLVERIQGCYYTIVGLPLSLLYQRLLAIGYPPPQGPGNLEDQARNGHAPTQTQGEVYGNE